MEEATDAPECAQTVLERPKRKMAAGMDQTGKGSVRAMDAPWQDMRDAIASGLSFAKVAKMFGEYHPNGWEGLQHVLRKRSQREGWTVPSTVIAQAQERLAAKGHDVSELSKSRVQTLRDPEKTETLLVQSLEEMGKSGSLIAGQLNLALLKDAARSPHKIAPLVDVKDIAVAAKTLRLVSGMDKPGPVVSLSLWGQGVSQVRDIGTSSGTSQAGPAIGEWSDLDGESE